MSRKTTGKIIGQGGDASIGSRQSQEDEPQSPPTGWPSPVVGPPAPQFYNTLTFERFSLPRRVTVGSIVVQNARATHCIAAVVTQVINRATGQIKVTTFPSDGEMWPTVLTYNKEPGYSHWCWPDEAPANQGF